VRGTVLPHNSPCRKKVSESWEWVSNCFVEHCGLMHAHSEHLEDPRGLGLWQ
jgi:hypothetical protein